jgi:hypothetical protein
MHNPFPIRQEAEMMLLAHRVERAALLANLAFADGRNGLETLSEKNLSIFDCSSSEELVSKLDTVLFVLGMGMIQDESTETGIELLGALLLRDGYERTLPAAEVIKQALEQFHPRAQYVTSEDVFMAINQAITITVTCYDNVVRGIHQEMVLPL